MCIGRKRLLRKSISNGMANRRSDIGVYHVRIIKNVVKER